MPKIKSTRNPFLHSLYLVLTIAGCWFWTNTLALSRFNLILITFAVIVYFVVHWFDKKTSPSSKLIFDAVVFTVILLLAIQSTGGLNSSLFFLVYFELFVISVIFDTLPSLIFPIFLAVFFLNTLTTVHSAIQLFSLFFFAALSLFFGKRYLKLLESQEKIKILKKEGKELKQEISTQETNSLLWLALNLKNGLLNITEKSSNLLSDLSHLTIVQKESLQSIRKTASDLLKSGDKLKEKIDKETD